MAKYIQMPPIYPIPHNWTWVELRQLTRIMSGYPFDSKSFSDLATEGRPLIRIRDVVRGYTETYTTEECPEQYIIHKNDILIGMDGDFSVGKWQNEDALLNQRVCFIQSVSDLLLNDYLFYFLPKPLKQINDVTPSVTVKHLSTKTIESIMIPLPPLEEQQRIVDRIDSLFAKLDESKEKAQEVVDGFETCKGAILNKAFSGKLTAKWREEKNIYFEEWKTCSLSQCCKISSGGTPSRKNREYYMGEIPWIKTGEIEWNEVVDSEEKISQQAIDNSSAKLYNPGAVLVAMYGMGVTRGRAAILGVKAATNQAVCVLQPQEYLYNRYLFYFFMCNYWSVREQAVGGNQLNLSATIIGKLNIDIPSVDEQMEIVRLLDNLISKQQAAKEIAVAVIEHVDTMKKTILVRAFRGELGTNDLGEEGAIELLKQII